MKQIIQAGFFKDKKQMGNIRKVCRKPVSR